MSVVSLKPAIDLAFSILQPVVAATIAGAVPIVTAFVCRKLHIEASGALNQRIITAASNGAALALSRGHALADANSSIDVKSAQIAAGVQYVQTALPNVLKAANISAPHLSDIVEAQLAKIQVSAPPATVVVPVVPTSPKGAP
jgi:hypothetical protein